MANQADPSPSPHRARPAHLLRDDGGAAALEFAMVAPPLLLFLFAVLGAGLAAFYQMTFDDAVRAAVRQMQIAGPAGASGAGFASAVCQEFGYLAPGCAASVTYNVQAAPAQTGFTSIAPALLPASGRFGDVFFAGTGFATGVDILVQAAAPLPFTLPFVADLITGNGTGSVLSVVAVRAEPF